MRFSDPQSPVVSVVCLAGCISAGTVGCVEELESWRIGWVSKDVLWSSTIGWVSDRNVMPGEEPAETLH